MTRTDKIGLGWEKRGGGGGVMGIGQKKKRIALTITGRDVKKEEKHDI